MCQTAALICYCTVQELFVIFNIHLKQDSGIVYSYEIKKKKTTPSFHVYLFSLAVDSNTFFAQQTTIQIIYLPSRQYINYINVQKCLLYYLLFIARRIASSSRSSTGASDWLLLAVTWQPREGLQTLIYSVGSSDIDTQIADRGFLLTTSDCLPILAALDPSPEGMSTRTLPLLFINLGGEMLYILDQRLRAQNIPADKAKKGRWQLICQGVDKASLFWRPRL